jgi:DUF1680 family protein
MTTATRLEAFPRRAVQLLDGDLKQRFDLNRCYLMSLSSDALLFNHRHEAVLAQWTRPAEHTGWEDPACQLRGHFLGHWLSAAARIWAATGDEQVKAKADAIVSELAKCQEQNGTGWAGSIPEKYLEKVVRKQPVWAPHYTLHKTLMGLWEMFEYAQNAQALDVLVRFADWFHRWTKPFTREQMNDILDYETGGMLEVWANLYTHTGEAKHRELVERYDRPRLFDPVARGEDVLSNRHANTMIPEICGTARAAEALAAQGGDDQRFRKIALAFWDAVVPSRMYATGGHTAGEMWSKPNELAGTLVANNQELCTVYNMMWLTKYLLRWTGEVKYADYYERNLLNGILSGQHPETGMFTYYHAFNTGGVKKWGSRTQDFWCCYGTGVQAFAELPNGIYFHDDDTLVANLLAPSRVEWNGLTATQTTAFPAKNSARIEIGGGTRGEKTIRLHVPWWTTPKASVRVNGTPQPALAPSSWCDLKRAWQAGDAIELDFPMALHAVPMPDDANLVAPMYGPLVLAGLVEQDVAVKGDPQDPSTWIEQTGALRFRTKGQPKDFDLIPMKDVVAQKFGVYFRVTP